MCRKADEESGGVAPAPWCQTGHCVNHDDKCGPPSYAAGCALTLGGDKDTEAGWTCLERRCYNACKRDSDCPADLPQCTPQGTCVFCYPGAKICEGDLLMICEPDGKFYELLENCGVSQFICNPDIGACICATD